MSKSGKLHTNWRLFDAFFLIGFVFILLSQSVFAQEQVHTRLDCTYERSDEVFGSGISLGVFRSSKSLSAIYDYPVKNGMQIDAKLLQVPGKLSFEVSHFSDDSVVRIDQHEIDVHNKEIVSSTLGEASTAIGYCNVSFNLPESGEDCSYWQADTDIARGGSICVSNHLPAYKTNTYGATSLMREGAWCGAIEAADQ